MSESSRSTDSYPSTSQETEEVPEENVVTLDEDGDELTEQRMLDAVQKIAGEDDQNQMEDMNTTIRGIVASRLKKFYSAINKVSGGLSSIDLESLPDTVTDDVYEDDDGALDHAPQIEPVEFKDITAEDFVKASDSIENLLKSPDFIACLEKIDVNREAVAVDEPLGNLIENIERCISENEIRDDIQSDHVTDTRDSSQAAAEGPKGLESDPEVQDEREIRKSPEFKQFVRKLLEAAKTDLIDVFTGDDLLESEEFENFCVQLFRTEVSGGIDYCKGDIGTNYVLKPVKDDPEEIFCTEKECEEMWNNLHLKSYYDCVTQNLDRAGLSEPNHRALLIGKISSAKRNVALRSHDDFISRIQKTLHDESLRISGVLIVFENFFFHIAESSTDGISNIIENTAQLVKQKVLEETKVVDIAHEIPNRFFKYWKSTHVRRVEKPIKKRAGGSNESELFLRMRELRERIRVLASFLQPVLHEDFGWRVDQLMPLDVLPEENELNYFMESELFMTVQEYVDKYSSLPEFIPSEEYELPPVRRFEVCQ